MNQRAIARELKVTPTAVAKALKGMDTEIVMVHKDPRMNLLSIELNRNNPKTIDYKRCENLLQIYESGITELLNEKYPGTLVILFGSYSYGTDILDSDIDIAIIGSNKKDLNLETFEKKLQRNITLQFYESVNKIHKDLRSNLFNGIVLKGAIEVE